MDRRIIIIHPSAIVQKGLHGILRDSFIDDFLLLSSIKDLHDYSSLTDMELIILIDECFATKYNNYFAKLKELKNSLYVIDITITNTNQENKICIYDEKDSIIKKVRNLIESHENKNDFSELSEREQDVLKLVALGFQNKEIAEKLFISIHTVISHRKNITEKLGIKSISGLTVYAILNKLIDTKNIDPSTLI